MTKPEPTERVVEQIRTAEIDPWVKNSLIDLTNRDWKKIKNDFKSFSRRFSSRCRAHHNEGGFFGEGVDRKERINAKRFAEQLKTIVEKIGPVKSLEDLRHNVNAARMHIVAVRQLDMWPEERRGERKIEAHKNISGKDVAVFNEMLLERYIGEPKDYNTTLFALRRWGLRLRALDKLIAEEQKLKEQE